MGGSWDRPNINSEPGKSKWLAKGNLEEMPHKSGSNPHKGVTQSLSLPLCLSTNNCSLFILISTLFVSVLSVFVGILFCKADGWVRAVSLTTGLVARCPHNLNLTLMFGHNWHPELYCCRLRPPDWLTYDQSLNNKCHRSTPWWNHIIPREGE